MTVSAPPGAPAMSPARSVSRHVSAIAGALLGLAWFLFLGGYRALDVTDVSWITGDHAQHLLGWWFFRNDPWTLPLGSISSLLHPVGTTLGFTDANPWVSVLLKPFSPWLPVDFQFIGAWLALCFVLQGFFGAKIMETLTRSFVQRVLGAALFVLAPPMLQRIGHDTLAAHWMLLAVIWITLRQPVAPRRTVFWMYALNFLAAGVHPYLSAMVMTLTFALFFRMSVQLRQLPRVTAAVLTGGVLVQTALIFTLLGYFGSPATLASGGFGFFSADLLAFLNPFDYSQWVPGLRAGEGQYEGFGYLGLGTIGLGVVAVVLGRLRNHSWWPDRARWPLVIAALLMFVFALSSEVTVGGYTIATLRTLYNPLGPIVEPMRSSGRFVWPLHYVIVTGFLAFVAGGKILRPAAATTLMAVAVMIQLAEVRPHARFIEMGWPRVQATEWDSLSSTYRHLVLYPGYYPVGPSECQGHTFEFPEVLKLSDLAYRKHLTVNSAYVARASMLDLAASCAQLDAEVAAGRFRFDTVYVVTAPAVKYFKRPEANMTCAELDEFNVCVSNALQSPFRRALSGEPPPE